MADVFDKSTRSRIMRAIRCRDTKPELSLRASLTVLGLNWQSGDKPVRVAKGYHVKLPGRPDVVFMMERLAVFVHGCFWHCCPRHFKAPKSGRRHGARGWARKFADNVRRDRRVRDQLRRMGWRTMVVWEHEQMDRAAARVARRLETVRTWRSSL